MKNKNLKQTKSKGFSLIELLVAMGISAVIITTAVGTVAGVYFNQKKVLISQDFYSESRFLMERVVQVVRNNTIDYDRYFEEIGPDEDVCSKFEAAQIPVKYKDSSEDDYLGDPPLNSRNTRETLGYDTIFYWDTNNDDDGEPDRNLGGKTPNGDIDHCTSTWHHKSDTDGNPLPLEELFLTNAARTVRTAIRSEFANPQDTTPCDGSVTPRPAKCDWEQIQIQRQLGADTDNDGVVDEWGIYKENDGSPSPAKFVTWDSPSGSCGLIYVGGAKPVKGDSTNEDFCKQSHVWTSITPPGVIIKNFAFHPAPDRDPYLNFRNTDVQVHPHVFLKLQTELANATQYGFEQNDPPQITLQTAASSRVFGDIRE